MDDVWARLRTATQNDEALVAFVQRLLTLDPGARANFGELVQTHPYMQPASQPVPVPGSLAASSAAVSAPAGSTITVSKDAATMPRLDVDKDVMQRLQSLPGLASVWWDITSVPVCHLSSGSVYRYITLLVLGLCAHLPPVMPCLFGLHFHHFCMRSLSRMSLAPITRVMLQTHMPCMFVLPMCGLLLSCSLHVLAEINVVQQVCFLDALMHHNTRVAQLPNTQADMSWQYRAWTVCGTGEWQQCLVKQVAVYPGGEAVDGSSTVPTHASLQPQVAESAAERVEAINASVDAANRFRGDMAGVPELQCAFADGQHNTLFK